ncbi:MAG: PilZ domain-containing protein [Acidobacteria bacterium]|nr:PilZ domain-containing protein [Acidobacteriota bacterium]
MIRELVSRFNRTWTERRASVRRKFQVPVKVCFAPVSDPMLKNVRCDDSFLSGETIDLSDTGIGFIVSSIRIKEKYLVGQQRPLNVELDLAGKRVKMRVLGVRYERVGIHVSTEQYLIGAVITEISDDDRAAYEHFMNNGKSLLQSYAPEFEFEA